MVKTQQTKNVVIVPVGSKGGFVIKQLPSSREEAQAVAKEQYQRFIHGLLSVTDNRDADGQVRPPKQTICYDDPDPYQIRGPQPSLIWPTPFLKRLDFGWVMPSLNGYDRWNHGKWECVRLLLGEIMTSSRIDHRDWNREI